LNTLLFYSNLIQWLRIIGAVGPLVYASVSDCRTRMVDDWVWVLMILVGSIVAIFETIVFQELRILLDLAINVSLSFTIAFLLFYAGLFGGADGKALISLSFLFPRPPSLFLEFGVGSLLPFYFLTILSNALLLTVLVPLCLFGWNLADYITNKDLFFGLENEPFWKKVITLFIGFRTNFPLPPHVHPLLDIVEMNGVLTLRLKLLTRVSTEPEENDDKNLQTIKEFIRKYGEKKIMRLWVSPGLPFLLPITLGLLTALTVGDLLLLILNILIP
jgi:preflagellin peptidase FlaK